MAVTYDTSLMTTEPPRRRIEDMVALIESFHVAQCAMAHERVCFTADGRAQTRSDGSARVFVRKGLCDWEHRAGQLSCAHTVARNRLDAIVEELATASIITPQRASALRRDIDDCANMIHETDWAMGEAAKRYAAARDAAPSEGQHSSATEIAAQAVATLERRHAVVVQRLVDLHREILAAARAALAAL
jgi:hypothetical protein